MCARHRWYNTIHSNYGNVYQDLFNLPDLVRGGDFVSRLAGGLEGPDRKMIARLPPSKTLTRTIASCFDLSCARFIECWIRCQCPCPAAVGELNR